MNKCAHKQFIAVHTDNAHCLEWPVDINLEFEYLLDCLFATIYENGSRTGRGMSAVTNLTQTGHCNTLFYSLLDAIRIFTQKRKIDLINEIVYYK